VDTRTITILVALAGLACAGGEAVAQERCKIKWEGPAANTQYTQQHWLDVGDMPGHQIGLFELRRTFPDDQPNCEGLKRVEQFSRGWRDYQDRNGRAWGYIVTTLDNGDKIFGEWSGTSHTVVAADGSRKSVFVGTVTWTGGTGKYQGVRGIQRDNIVFDPEKNLNQSQSEAEYWFEK
jgi:hypothetical protein